MHRVSGVAELKDRVCGEAKRTHVLVRWEGRSSCKMNSPSQQACGR